MLKKARRIKMPAYLDSMMYVGDKPWHNEGTPLGDPPTIPEALEKAGLNWMVCKKPTYYRKRQENGSYDLTETGHYITMRIDTCEPLGNVSQRYEILQNKDAFEPFEPLIDNGFKLETAGSVQDGRKVWILAKAPEKYLVGNDKIDRYILMYTSHDGSAGNCMRDTAIRVVCYNTLMWSLEKSSNAEYQFRHTASIREKVLDLKDNLTKSEGNFKKAIDQMNRMREVSFTEELAGLYFEAVIPFLQNRGAKSNKELGIVKRDHATPVFDKLIHNFKEGAGNKGETLWDAYNAVTEYYDHQKTYKDWVGSTVFGSAGNYKTTAFQTAQRIAEGKSATIVTA
jgi:phage/plasmid-like protein (TIGR03299 family)